MAKLIDPLKQLKDEREANGELSAAQIARLAPGGHVRAAVGPIPTPPVLGGVPKAPPIKEMPGATLEQRAKADFRVFLTIIWRHLLGNDPNPIQLDLAYWLQHGPDRAIIMAFRGFSKSWITGAYALWRLFVNPDEKVMVVSGSLMRAVATSNWCLSLVLTIPMLAPLRPKPSYRQSGQMWDVGNCIPQQSASFTAFGIGGQLVGFRGSLIIPDDVETQTNSLTVVMREKIREAVKEFESVLVPGGQIKYLGTPHDMDSLYMYLLRLRNDDGSQVYQARIWTALYPTEAEVQKYKGLLAPYVTSQIRKLGPSCIGHSTMPMRFSDEDLAKRKAAMGNSEFRLQFMLDLDGSFIDKYPLKLKDLIVMELDPQRGPEELVWGTSKRDLDLTVPGFDGDYCHKPVHVGEFYSPYSKIIGFIDSSGRGTNETSLAIGGELFGRVFLLRLWATTKGYEPETLRTIAQLCVKLGVSTLYVEGNHGDGMFIALLRPALIKEWQQANQKARKRLPDAPTGTEIEEVKSGAAQKEKRILSVLEPVTQQHRLVVNREVFLWDEKSIQEKDGEDTRHRYAFGYQYTHLTREKDCLGEDDRLESVAGLCAMFAPELEVEPLGMALRRKEEREDDLMRELEEEDEAISMGRQGAVSRPELRARASRIQTR